MILFFFLLQPSGIICHFERVIAPTFVQYMNNFVIKRVTFCTKNKVLGHENCLKGDPWLISLLCSNSSIANTTIRFVLIGANVGNFWSRNRCRKYVQVEKTCAIEGNILGIFETQWQNHAELFFNDKTLHFEPGIARTPQIPYYFFLSQVIMPAKK